MKKTILTVIILCFSTIPVFGQDIREVSIAWEDGLKPPYLMLDKYNQPFGIAVDMLTDILLRNQIKPKHKIIPWKRCLVEIQKKKVDVVPNSSYKKDRATYAYYTKPFYQTHLVLFYKKNKFKRPPEITTVDHMKPFRIGGVLGFNYDHYGGRIEIDTGAKTREALILKLHYDRIDFAVLQSDVLFWVEKERKVNLKGLAMVPDPVRPVKIFHALTVQNPRGKKIKKIIDTGIDILHKDGTIDKIMKKYYGKDYRQK